MADILFVLAAFAFMTLFGLAIWLFTLLVNDKKEPKDAPIDLNFLSHKDTGNFIGIETSAVGAKDGRHFIKMLPKDVSYDKKESDVEEVSIIADRNKVLSFAKGTISKHRSVNIILPKTASDFHEAIKQTDLGRGLMIATEMQNAVNAEIRSLLEGHDRKDKVLEKLGHGEISKEFMTFLEEQYKDALRFSIDAKNKEKSSSTLTSQSLKKE